MKLDGDKLLADLQKAIEINEFTANILAGSKKIWRCIGFSKSS